MDTNINITAQYNPNTPPSRRGGGEGGRYYAIRGYIIHTEGALSKLYVAYHNILKLLVGVSKFERNSPICAFMNVQTCAAVI